LNRLHRQQWHEGGFFARYTKAMQALFVAWYNFGRKHEALKGNTPAMASNL
jgi:hypothetical protein